MVEVKVKLVSLWAALMLVYLLGDVLRLYSGDFTPGGEIQGVPTTQGFWLAAAIFMTGPVLMILLSLALKDPVNRWANVIGASLYFAFNLLGLPGYASAFDKYLIIVGLGLNILTVWSAWTWG